MKKLSFTIFFALSIVTTQAQLPVTDSAQVLAATEIYFKDRGQELAIFNGPRCPVYATAIHGIPFFPDKTFQSGSVLYDGIWYHDFPLRYDVVADQLTIQQKDLNGIPSVIFNGRVDRFYISDAEFLNLEKGNGLPRAGYYQVLVKGAMGFLVKRRKVITETIADTYRNGTVERDFQVNDEYYVLKGGSYIAVKKKKELLNLLGEKRKEVSHLLGKSNLSFRKNKEQYILIACQFYNQQTY